MMNIIQMNIHKIKLFNFRNFKLNINRKKLKKAYYNVTRKLNSTKKFKTYY